MDQLRVRPVGRRHRARRRRHPAPRRGATTQSEGFETGLGPWAAAEPPTGGPASAAGFRRSEGLLSAAVTTRGSVLLGFGVEQRGSRADRARVLGKSLDRLDGTR